MTAQPHYVYISRRETMSVNGNKVDYISSVLGLVGICFLLGSALYVQFGWSESPCPLCLLQRASFVAIGLAMLMNLRYGNRVQHWAIAIIMGCVGAAVSIRQIFLHITSPVGFGSPILGLHMYTWCFFGFVTAIVGSAIMLMFYPDRR